jgi:glutamate 5-kinase
LLLTRDDFDSRTRYVNARNTLWALLEMGAVPVINENDTVAVDELKFGDNDVLSVLVAHLLHADLLILLTSVPGLLRPSPSGGEQAVILDVVENLDESVLALATSERSKLGSGGMQSKLGAVKMALDAGEPAVIANGREANVLVRILDGEKLGTLFVPSAPRMKSWSRWIGFAAQAKGHIQVDEGAEEALVRRGKSLLASGIIGVRGTFKRGDPVVIEDLNGNGFAKGLSNYASEDIEAIKGFQTRQIKKLFGEAAFMEVVHRNNLVLMG